MKTTEGLLCFGDNLAISAELSLDESDNVHLYVRELISSAYAIADLIRARHAGGEGSGSTGITSDAAQGMQLILSVAEAVLRMEGEEDEQP